MTKSLIRDTNTITIAIFWENNLLGKYNFNPPYQRKSIWSDEKQSFFIDSILKNFPIPPIFLRQQIDDDTGKTKYDVIDGKQRLTSIIRFINNEIPASDESEENPFFDLNVAGIYFKEFDERSLSEYKRKFWRYVIPIEYIDTLAEDIIDNIFDRLNRNGEPLNGQELRNSKYHNSLLLNLSNELSKEPFWQDRLKHVDVNRMEDIEFISELLFSLLEGEPLHANQLTLDELYEQYANADEDWSELKSKFLSNTNFLSSLELDFDEFRITGVSHLYGLWCFADYCKQNNKSFESVKPRIHEFYRDLRSKPHANENLEQYKKSMSSRTKDKGQRRKRLEALINHILKK